MLSRGLAGDGVDVQSGPVERAVNPAGLTRRRQLAKALAAAVMGVFLAAAVGEALARGYAWLGGEVGARLATRDPLGVLYEPYGNFGYRQKAGKSEGYKNGTRAHWNAMAYRGPLVSLDKPAGTYRIVLLGGSTTAGYGVNDDETIDAHMRRLLHERVPGACIEVVNLALGGYDSYQDYERMRVDGTRLSPDLVIINSGINDVRNAKYPNLGAPPDPRTLIWESVMRGMREEQRHGPSTWNVVLHYSYLARTPGFALERLRQRQDLKEIRVTEPDPSAVDYFETNVVRTIDLAMERNAAVILSTPPSALSFRNQPTDPPERTYWIRDAGTTEQYRERLATRMREIAGRQSAAGRSIRYVTHRLPAAEFLDDAHLTGGGNLTVARNLTEAALPAIRAAAPNAGAAERPCLRPSS